MAPPRQRRRSLAPQPTPSSIVRGWTFNVHLRIIQVKGRPLSHCEARLLRLLGHGALLTTHVPADVRRIGRLLDDVLERLPSLSRSRRRALVRKLGINAGGELGDGALDESALRDAGTEEDGVDAEQDPRALLEKKRRAENTEPESNLKDSNERHAAIVVFLDELSNHVRRCGFGLGTGWRGTSGLLGLNGGEKVRAHIGCNVEHRVDSKRKDSHRDLAREEPDESHDCTVLARFSSSCGCGTYSDTAHSHR
jgi:hypothetical protein